MLALRCREALGFADLPLDKSIAEYTNSYSLLFTLVPDASKVALVYLVRQLHTWGFRIVDCQQASPHVMRFGAEEIPRREFLDHIATALTLPDRRRRWQFDIP